MKISKFNSLAFSSVRFSARSSMRSKVCSFACLAASVCMQAVSVAAAPLTPEAIKDAFKGQSISLDSEQIGKITESVTTANRDRCASPGNSKVRFAAVDIADRLGLNSKTDVTLVPRIETALNSFSCAESTTPLPQPVCDSARTGCGHSPIVDNPEWAKYFEDTINATGNADFLRILAEKQFAPVKISWEDIGRYQGSVWGDRISDVGIWVRKDEANLESAKLALSVRRDNNFRDRVLVVPTEKIKVHLREGSETKEFTLSARLEALGLASGSRDKNVIVSNQFAIVPVPPKQLAGSSDPARAAFNFSIYPYGSTNYVITDVIEGSSDAIVGPGNHQLLFANVNGKKAPFTASRAAERQDLMKLEADLKAKGMDVDVQRYYLIQIPLKKGVSGIKLSNMGTPPMQRFFATGAGFDDSMILAAPMAEQSAGVAKAPKQAMVLKEEPGLAKVAIGHGETEGEYNAGDGFRGQRTDEPVRVTVVYFVTPVGKLNAADVANFSKAFEAWDEQAIWGGSFVVKDDA